MKACAVTPKRLNKTKQILKASHLAHYIKHVQYALCCYNQLGGCCII